jgi:hypothetical protein
MKIMGSGRREIFKKFREASEGNRRNIIKLDSQKLNRK